MKSRQERKALRTGLDASYNPLNYVCPICGWEISLQAKRCPKCASKRPKDAYRRALSLRDQVLVKNTRQTVYIDRSAQALPSAKAPCYASTGVQDVNSSCYATYQLEQLGIPKYYTTDEYGRVFETPVSYTSLPHAGPVPVPKPSKTIQTNSIQVPIDLTNK